MVIIVIIISIYISAASPLEQHGMLHCELPLAKASVFSAPLNYLDRMTTLDFWLFVLHKHKHNKFLTFLLHNYYVITHWMQ